MSNLQKTLDLLKSLVVGTAVVAAVSFVLYLVVTVVPLAAAVAIGLGGTLAIMIVVLLIFLGDIIRGVKH